MNSQILFFALSSFIITFIILKFLPFEAKLLGHDRGRKFVQGSEINKGKPTGVGLYFISVFIIISFICLPKSLSFSLVFLVIIFSMLSGYFDDISATPWNEYIKGFLDIIIAVIAGFICTYCWGSEVYNVFSGSIVKLNWYLFLVLAIILFIVSINATNATDGVDGLSGTLSIFTIATLMIVTNMRCGLSSEQLILGLIFIATLLAYLCFNHYPSKMLMGDAGSRAIGTFIALYAIYLKVPFAYLIVGIPFLFDGGISILKITIGRISSKVLHKKIIILKNIITPFHDHLKKRHNFSSLKAMLTISFVGLVIDVCYILINVFF